MDTVNKIESYTLPFFQKLKMNLKLKLLFFLVCLIFTIWPIYIIFHWDEQWIYYNTHDSLRRLPPNMEAIICCLILLIMIYQFFIKYRNNYLSITENYIEKRSGKGIKKIQWIEIQTVELYNKEMGKYGPNIGIILKDQSNPWRNHINDLDNYYIVIEKLLYDDIEIDKLYLTLKNQLDRHNSNSASANGSQQTKPS